MSTVDDFLEHYGVKGMRWGVRRRRGVGSDGPEGVTVNVKKGHGVVETSGGHHHEVSAEAVRAAAVRQVAAKSSTSALTNKDLQDAVNRMNLEKNYNKLMLEQAPKKGAARQFIEGMVTQYGQQEIARVMSGQLPKTVGFVNSVGSATGSGRHAVGRVPVPTTHAPPSKDAMLQVAELLGAAAAGKHRK